MAQETEARTHFFLFLFFAHARTYTQQTPRTHARTKTHSSIRALQGITEQAGVNELIITANSICHRDQSRPGATTRDVLCVYIYTCVWVRGGK